jgi:hypothetical protein
MGVVAQLGETLLKEGAVAGRDLTDMDHRTVAEDRALERCRYSRGHVLNVWRRAPPAIGSSS